MDAWPGWLAGKRTAIGVGNPYPGRRHTKHTRVTCDGWFCAPFHVSNRGVCGCVCTGKSHSPGTAHTHRVKCSVS